MLQELEKRKELILNLGVKPEQFGLIVQFLENLISSNEELNLVSRQLSMTDLVDNHLIDCLLAFKYLPKQLTKVADFGSGGGFPGVLYATLRPEIEYFLFEKSPKKQHYLKTCQKFAPNIKICGEIPKDFGQFDLVTARAFKPINVIIEMSYKYFQSNGKYFLLKGRMDKIQEEILDSKKFSKNLKIEIKKLDSPILDVERHLVLLNF